MFHRADDPSLPRTYLNAFVLPRPIGWVSTIDADGRGNLAPYSFFNAVAYDPPHVLFASTGPHRHEGEKDSIRGARATGELVFSLATYALREAVNRSSAALPPGVDEFDHCGLTRAPSTLVAPPRVADSPLALECRVVQIVDLESGPRASNTVVIAKVVGYHVDPAVVRAGRIDPLLLDPIGRLGYDQYARVSDVFSMTRPDDPV